MHSLALSAKTKSVASAANNPTLQKVFNPPEKWLLYWEAMEK